ncbi:MAG: hypothetical protein ACLFTR_03405 [Candidatus Woesearchaeota archaeon]
MNSNSDFLEKIEIKRAKLKKKQIFHSKEDFYVERKKEHAYFWSSKSIRKDIREAQMNKRLEEFL